MRIKWKKVFFWSSLGSVAVAFAVSVARKAQKPPVNVPEYQPIPADCSSITIRTEVFGIRERDVEVAFRDEYRVQPTAFKVWNVLELQAQPAADNPEGTTIYHVSRLRKRKTTEAEGELVERFYGTIRSVDPASRLPRKDQLARGAILEIARCYVGGASNGIETGEVHRSGAPVLEFVFERPGIDGAVTETRPSLS